MITPATTADHPAIIKVWELSVRATHHFITEEYLQEIKALLPSILPQVNIYVWKENDTIKGFVGVAGDKIEMLFIHPDSRGKGLGRGLTEFCINKLHADKVDVNEQNEQAVTFYERMGFKIKSRQDLDGLGRPYPLLIMEFVS